MAADLLFASARSHVEKLERRIAELETELERKAGVVAGLLLPCIVVTGPRRHEAALAILTRGFGQADGVRDGDVHAVEINNKYYTARMNLVVVVQEEEELPPTTQAVIWASCAQTAHLVKLDGVSDASEVEARVCLSVDDTEFSQEFRERCLDFQVECVEEEGVNRVMEVLSAVMWQGMVRKGNSSPQQQQVLVVDEEEDDFMDLVGKIKQTVEESKHLPDDERRKRAALVALEVCRLLGDDE
jgi:hypothetical protein